MADEMQNREDSPKLFGGCSGARVRPRERIVDVASDLFHRHGIRAIGVDTIAQAAGTNKMTLYRHFGSKDELIIEVLERVSQAADQKWGEIAASAPDDPAAQLRAWLRLAATKISEDGRGCDMANTAVEFAEADHPTRRVVEAFKTEQRNRLARLCASAGASQPDLLADALFLLLEGARVSRQSVGAEGPSARFVRMGEAIIASFGAAAPPPKA
jgi:AcrR family transcriptional regulator